MIVEISTAIAVIKGAKAAFEVAKEAFDEIRECAEAGKSANESLGSLTKFFSAAGKAEEGINQAKQLQESGAVEDTRNDYEIVIDMMVAERQLRQFYVDLREMFTYQFQEPGLYDEFIQRLDKLRADRRKKETEARLAIKAAEMKERRNKAKKLEKIYNAVAVALGSVVSFVIMYGVYWMFTFKDR